MDRFRNFLRPVFVQISTLSDSSDYPTTNRSRLERIILTVLYSVNVVIDFQQYSI